ERDPRGLLPVGANAISAATAAARRERRSARPLVLSATLATANRPARPGGQVRLWQARLAGHRRRLLHFARLQGKREPVGAARCRRPLQGRLADLADRPL